MFSLAALATAGRNRNRQILNIFILANIFAALFNKFRNSCKECLYNRDKREGIDLVHDAVEIQLNQEVEVIRSCQEKMKRLIARADHQLQLVALVNYSSIIFLGETVAHNTSSTRTLTTNSRNGFEKMKLATFLFRFL